jgi:hypothetical protein
MPSPEIEEFAKTLVEQVREGDRTFDVPDELELIEFFGSTSRERWRASSNVHRH